MASVRHLGFFPFCVSHEPPPTDPEFWPLASLSVAASVALFWRVKEFRIHFSAPPATGFVRVYRTATNEQQLICNPNSAGIAALPTGEPSSGPDEPPWRYDSVSSFGQIIINSQSIPLFGPRWFQKDNNRFMWDFSISILSIKKNENDEIEQEQLNIIGVSYDVTGSITLPIHGTDGATFNVSSYGILGPPTSMSVFEYWPYDPNDGGGPIYNSATGARIRFDV